MNDKEILELARARLTMAVTAMADSRENELDDLRFFAGNSDNAWQWPADVLQSRGSMQGQSANARPTLTINKLPQHVRQVTNEQRQNRPQPKVIPVDADADTEIADIYNGMIRHIEYISDADVAYDTACENQVTYGEGYARILTDYCDADTFDQDIKIGRIRNSFSVYMDPLIQDPCGADAQWCIITEDVPTEEYIRLHPKAHPISALQTLGIGDQEVSQWINDKTVRVAEYYYIEHTSETLNLYPGGHIARAGTPEDRELVAVFGKAVRSRKADRKQVKWLKTNGYEILERTDWAGKYIPVVRCVGNEVEVEGRVYVSGIIRNAKDAQRMYNYWTSQEAEMLALAPKAPFIGYGGQFEGYEHQWKTANTTNWPYLEVNVDVTDGAGSPLPLPTRSAPPMIQNGLIAAKLAASEDIKGTTGQYDASLGIGGNERSGKAILARQKEGDTGTYHFVDNYGRFIRYIGRQIIDLIPKIYDTQRIARIIGEDGESKMIKINPEQTEPVKKIVDDQGVVLEKIFNPGVGTYDVMVITGPGFATKRQEAAESMSVILQGNPELWSVAGDLFIKNMDWPGAQEIAQRFRKMIDPKLLGDGEDNPELQAAKQQMEAMNQELQQMSSMLQNVQDSFEARDAKTKEFEAQIKAFDAETKRISIVQASMSPDQIQDIVLGTVHGMLTSGDLYASAPEEAAEQPMQGMQGMQGMQEPMQEPMQQSLPVSPIGES